MDAVAAIARTSISLVAVLGLLYLISRWLRRRQGGVAGAGEFAVIARQSLGAKAGVALVKVGDRALVVGVSDAGVNLLGETELAAVFKESAESAEDSSERVTGTSPDGAEPSEERTSAQPAVGERYVRKGGETIAVKSPASHAPSGIAGSALSPATWSKAVDVLRERTTRR